MNKIYQKLLSDEKNAGFTLIELLVVVLIIGILSAVALPQYQKAVLRARAAEGIALLHSIEKAEEMYFLANGEYTTDLDALDLELPKFHCVPNSLCQFLSPGGEFLWEITFSGMKGFSLYCAAKTTDNATNQICQSLGKFSHINGPRSYYRLTFSSHK